ncbi:uncharacterized protein LOC111101954 isoform X2 [Crassostrea virginica]
MRRPKSNVYSQLLWAEVFRVHGDGDYMRWERVSADVVPINISCIEDRPSTVFQVTAYNKHVEKIFDVKITQPDSILLHDMDPTRISTQVSVKHCSLCQGDTEYYCFKCQQDLCIQCKKLHVIDLSTKHHKVTSYTEKMKYPPKQVKSSQSGDPKQVISVRHQNSKQIKRWRSGDPKQVFTVCSQDPDNHELCVMPLIGLRPRKFQPPVCLSPLERSEIQRRQYSDRIYQLRGETIYYRSVLLEGLRHDRDTGHKAVTIRGQSKAEMRGQGLKDLIDEVLAGDLEDRCIIQKTRMTRHMTKLLWYYHRFEQLSKTMETRSIKFLRIMTRKHSPRKDTMKTIINMLVNLMKEIRLVPSGIPRRAGVEDLLTLLSSPVVQKSLSVTGVDDCRHISCVTPDRVWVSDWDNIILTDIATGKQLHSVEHPLRYSGSAKHTVNCEGELIYIDKERNIIKLCNDMETTTTLIKHTDKTWRPRSVYCSPSSGDLLVGMCREDTDSRTNTGKVMRYDNTGKYKQTISHDDNTPHTLYELPVFITENNNGDVLVSDVERRAVVVTSGEGVHRFSYTGPPPSGSGLFYPLGICTDVMSHILVSDLVTATVQMLDRDGQFLSYVLTEQTPGMDYEPWGLSYDVTTHAVWVGAAPNNTMSVCQYINRHLHLADEREHHSDLDDGETNSDFDEGETNSDFDEGETNSDFDEGETHRDFDEGETNSHFDEGETNSHFDEGETNSDFDEGETHRDFDEGETNSDFDEGETNSDSDEGETNSDFDTGETNSDFDEGETHRDFDEEETQAGKR